MNLTFLGAAHEVTGSCYYLEACGKHILIDCGLEQGPDEYLNQDIPVIPSNIDYVFITHAHIDHTGRLPLLYRNGFKGTIFSTTATNALCNIMLRDSAHIQMFEAEWRNKKAQRAGRELVEPLYDMEDADGVLQCFSSYIYDKIIPVSEGIEIRFIDVGHLLGSASIEVWINEQGIQKKLVFSGDIGNFNQPLLHDPQYISDADYVIMESTYGDRSHGELPDYTAELTSIIQSTFDKGGNVIIPSFAVGRTQELLYFLRIIKAEHLIKGHGNFSVYVDSPLAIEATNIFSENISGYFDEEALNLVRKGINPISFDGLKTTTSSEESKAINFDERPKVIISASGMCEAGRIKHHLKHNLWRPENTILFVGYQAIGTLGRAIIEGANPVKLFGEEVEVRASIKKLEGISGHADNEGLMTWIKHFHIKPQHVFVTHGEDKVCEVFADRLRTELGLNAIAPYPGAKFDLVRDMCIQEGSRARIEKKAEVDIQGRITSAFMALLASGNRLITVIHHNKDGANKDLKKFASEIDKLSEKWDR